MRLLKRQQAAENWLNGIEWTRGQQASTGARFSYISQEDCIPTSHHHPNLRRLSNNS